MMMMGIELTGEVPFRDVHMHGTGARRRTSKKMSKTRGNTIDPLDINEKYGTDAVRMSLLMGTGAGTDIVYTEDRLTTARNFANKLWNAARLIFLNMERSGVEPRLTDPVDPETMEDRWMFSRINQTAASVDALFEQHRYNEVAQELWHLFWDEFCDWYLEVKKLRLGEGTGLDENWRNLLYVFSSILRFLHPLIPFITEELWHRLDPSGESIALASYPAADAEIELGENPEADMQLFQRIVTEVRNLRADQKLDKKQHLKGTLECEPETFAVAERELPIVEKLANVKLTLKPAASLKLTFQLPEADKSATRARLEKEIAQLRKLIAGIDAQFADEASLNRKPEHIVAGMREKRAGYDAQLTKAQAALDVL